MLGRKCTRCGCTDGRTCDGHKGSEPGVWARSDLCARCTSIGYALPELTPAKMKGMTRSARRRAARLWFTSFYGRPDRPNEDEPSRSPMTRRYLLGHVWSQFRPFDDDSRLFYQAIRQRYGLPHLAGVDEDAP